MGNQQENEAQHERVGALGTRYDNRGRVLEACTGQDGDQCSYCRLHGHARPTVDGKVLCDCGEYVAPKRWAQHVCLDGSERIAATRPICSGEPGCTCSLFDGGEPCQAGSKPTRVDKLNARIGVCDELLSAMPKAHVACSGQSEQLMREDEALRKAAEYMTSVIQEHRRVAIEGLRGEMMGKR